MFSRCDHLFWSDQDRLYLDNSDYLAADDDRRRRDRYNDERQVHPFCRGG